MKKTRSSSRPLWLFATFWSLRQYPSKSREWSWAKKFDAIRKAGFDGIFCVPQPCVKDRGDLRYLAVTSLGLRDGVEKPFREAKALGAVAMDVQLCDWDTPIPAAVKLAVRIRAVAKDYALPFAIENHRDTLTETPEKTLALAEGYRRATGEAMPCCLDHSHYAVVRHYAPGTFWENLRKPDVLLRAATQLHLRPFNGHHCQIPVLTPDGRRTPEYKDWLVYAEALFDYLKKQSTTQPLLAVPELSNAAPAYNLSCFPDTWKDVSAEVQDLRRLWRS